MKVFITIGSAGVCFILAWLSFSTSALLGFLFLVVGIGIVVLGLASGKSPG
jgi:hypothetical protein